MARQTIVRLTDDFDGTVAATTVRFSWDGVAYEIDLSTAHAEAFAAVVQPYVDAARRVGPARRGARPAARAGAGTRRGVRELAPIRAWARENNVRVADRGRIPAHVIEAYHAAQHEARPAPVIASAVGTTRVRRTTTSRRSPATGPAANRTAANRTAAKKGVATSASPRTATKQTATKKTSVRKSATKVPRRKPAARKTS